MTPIWKPDAKRMESSAIVDFIKHVNRYDLQDIALYDYHSLHQWSLDHSETFWESIWDFTKVVGNKGSTLFSQDSQSPAKKSIWFPEATLNFAENLLKQAQQTPDQDAIIFSGEDEQAHSVTWHALDSQVAHIAAYLKQCGIGKGDVVAGYLPNLPETIVATLATASLGAIWTSISPDFGVESVLERFGQTEPKVLLSTNTYDYKGKVHECLDKASAVIESVPSIKNWIIIPFASSNIQTTLNYELWQSLIEGPTPELSFERVAFNDPLYILYSSGTTGKPKCIVHSVGGTLLNHLKELHLHSNLQADDKIFYFTTCSWMMWNWMISSLGVGATLVLFDGSPFYPDAGVLWRLAHQHQVKIFGTSAKYLETLEQQKYFPKQHHDFTHLEVICSTGSVLSPEQFDFVYQHIKPDLQLSSISGGTDICGCFALGSPISPVYRGEVQVKGLGLDVQVFNEKGESVQQQKGELVCVNSFPNQPIGFWNDPKGKKYHHAYWNRIHDVWFHGDYIELTQNQGIIFFGRSDATLNPGGVRIGTAEIYRCVNRLDEIQDSVAIGQEWQQDIRLVLFVKLLENMMLTDEIIQKIKTSLRNRCSPRHVPALIAQVSDIPYTRSGKLAELAVRDVVHGRSVQQLSALRNPECLEQFIL